MASTARPSTIVLSVDVEDQSFAHAIDSHHEQARLLVWSDDTPTGVVDIALPVVDHAALAQQLAMLTPQKETARPSRWTDSSVTVVVATHNRPHTLVRCIKALFEADIESFQIIVVDNAPADDAALLALTENFGGSHRLQYLVEHQPGLAAAHNAALAHIHTDVVLFTDDDVIVDRRWIRAMSSAFDASPDIACVTGLIMPAELETDTQWLIEETVGFSKGFDRKCFDLGTNRPDDPLFPLTAGSLGSGANMGFRTDYLREVGGFDVALGAGSRGAGGDDLAAFIDVIETGHKLVYEPAAVVFHPHHRSPKAARAMAHGYGKGLTAALTSSLLRHPRLVRTLLRRLPEVLRHGLAPSSPKNDGRSSSYPRALVLAELAGMAMGPWAYLRSRVAVRASRGRSDVAATVTFTDGAQS